jgi:predicted tellurium resistance membrane protein TerC
LGASVFALALVIAIVGASTNSAPIVVGVFGGLTVMIFALVFIFKAKSSLRKELESSRKVGDPPE